ncbi:hypothetical protein JR316_0008816 [Psilocybe cubensis]|uniref:Uncharacterized protein n=2 Tax=Psilocybe cubensis TaxID=181762 RepID=A0ACB8GSM3_PSICU|nr:hypothetical protein JR316_0008816 [Psilocybe cubensis]KAH9478362.1 hypothetical protein JR316_0008816 [Psilocybe cubensis]
MNPEQLDDLAKNNLQPAEDTILVVKELLSAPTEQLEAISLEIKRLDEKRKEIEKSIRGYQRILAPIRRVPPDILRTVFEHCLVTHRNPTMAATEAPMLLTRVCSSWRTIALASPRLWAQIHIPFRKEGREDQFRRLKHVPMAPLQKVRSILHDRCRAVNEWLSRSGNLPLSISVNEEQGYLSPSNIEARSMLDASGILLLSILKEFSPRWMELEMTVSYIMYNSLERMLSGHTLPSLLRLRALIYHTVNSWNPSTVEVKPSPIILLRAPNLKYVSINHPTISDLLSSPTITSAPQPVPWTKSITHVSLTHCNPDDCIKLLMMYPQLVRCNFVMGNVFDQDMLQQIVIPSIIHLPQLLSLGLSTIGNSVLNFIPTLLDIIHVPQLRWLRYYNNSSSFNREDIPEAMMDQIPSAFFGRSSNLTTLELDRFCLMPSNILDVLEALDGLIHLALTCKHGLMPRNSIMQRLDGDTFNLECLVVRANGNVVDELPYKELLPRLEIFELYRTLASDDLLLRFVDSRMNPSSHVAVLKKVSIHFDRLREEENLDLAHEIRVRGNAVGVHVVTEFSYSTSTLEVKKKKNFMSPSYIPSSKDVTWKQQDFIDE